MLKAAIIFFVLGLIVMLIGALGVIPGMSIELGEMLLSIFFIFSLMGFIGSSELERKRNKDNR